MSSDYAPPLAQMATTAMASVATSTTTRLPQPYQVQRTEQSSLLHQQQPQQRPEERSAEQAAFEYLDNVLNASWNMPLEVEILPPALQRDEYVVRIIENCVGIPQRLLALAFVYARLLFFHGIPQLVRRGLPAMERLRVRSIQQNYHTRSPLLSLANLSFSFI